MSVLLLFIFVLGVAPVLFFGAPLAYAQEDKIAPRTGKFWSDERIYTDLLNAGIADEIGERCEGLGVRRLRGIFHLTSLYNYALTQGHKGAEVRAFVKDKQEKARLRLWAIAHLKTRGVDAEDTDSLCDFGDFETRQKTPIGRLLWQK